MKGVKNIEEKKIIILGAGGHAKVIAEALRLAGKAVAGFLAPDKKKHTVVCGAKVLGDDSEISKYSPEKYVLANGIGALPKKILRWQLAELMRQQGYKFVTVIHPSAIISEDAIVEEGSQCMAGTIVQPGCRIGQDSILNTNVVVDHDCTIDKCCHLAPGVVCSGGVTVEPNVHIGTGAQVVQNMTIGAGSIIAAGTTVYQNVPAGMLVRHSFTTEKIKIEDDCARLA